MPKPTVIFPSRSSSHKEHATGFQMAGLALGSLLVKSVPILAPLVVPTTLMRPTLSALSQALVVSGGTARRTAGAL